MDIISYVHNSVELLFQILGLVAIWTRRSMEVCRCKSGVTTFMVTCLLWGLEINVCLCVWVGTYSTHKVNDNLLALPSYTVHINCIYLNRALTKRFFAVLRKSGKSKTRNISLRNFPLFPIRFEYWAFCETIAK